MSAPVPTPEDTEADFLDFLSWIDEGTKRGWISLPTCTTHEGLPLRAWEETDIDEGADPCVLAMRVWKDGFETYTPEDNA